MNGNRILLDLPPVTGLSPTGQEQLVDYITENCKSMLGAASGLGFFGILWCLFSDRVYFMGSGLELVTRVDEELCCITYYSFKGDLKYFETKELDPASRRFVSRLHRCVVICVLDYWREILCLVGLLASRLNLWITRLQLFSMVSAMAMYFYGLTNEHPLFLGLSLLSVLLVLLLYVLKRII